MRILGYIGIIIGILLGCFILLGLAAYLGETVSTFSEKTNAAYDDSYQQAYSQIYDVRYQEGYKGQYDIGYEQSYKKGFDEAYNKAYDEAYENGLETGYKEGLATRVDLHNPTYKELLLFLRRDRTDSKRYIEGEYDCSDFSAEVNNNAEFDGIRAAYVIIYYPQLPGHAIVAFQTVDKGLIFIEPISDETVKLVVGKRYYKCIEPKPGYYYKKPSHDDTIVEIQIVW